MAAPDRASVALAVKLDAEVSMPIIVNILNRSKSNPNRIELLPKIAVNMAERVM